MCVEKTRLGLWGVTNGIRSDPRGFTGAYGSVEKDTMMYESGTWVHTHDVWVLWEEHGMVYAANWTYDMCMLVLDVRTWPRGDVPGLGLTDEDVSLLRGVDCDILIQALIGLIEYSYHQCIPSFLKAQLQRTSGLSVLGPEQFQDG
jgi:hypothetical protein